MNDNKIQNNEPSCGESEKRKSSLSRRGTPLDQFLDSYQSSASSAAATQNKKKTYTPRHNNEERTQVAQSQNRYKKGEKKRSGKVASVAVALAIIAAIMIVLAVSLIGHMDNRAAAEKNAEFASDVAKYVSSAKAAAEANKAFDTEKYHDSSEALMAFANMINPGLSAEWQINYTDGSSYAIGKVDPWGSRYYITAKQIDNRNTSNTYLFEFYISSAGENGNFDTKSFVLDKDDKYELLISMSDYAEMSGDHSFLDPEETDNAEDPLARIPLTFDMAGGNGGTSFVEVTPGANLPVIEIPSREGYVFIGYYEFPNGVGVRYYNADGTGAIHSPFTDGTTLYAAWDVDTSKPEPSVAPDTEQTETPDAEDAEDPDPDNNDSDNNSEMSPDPESSVTSDPTSSSSAEPSSSSNLDQSSSDNERKQE